MSAENTQTGVLYMGSCCISKIQLKARFVYIWLDCFDFNAESFHPTLIPYNKITV